MPKYHKHILFSAGWYPNTSGFLSSPFVKRHAEAISLYERVSVLGVFSKSGIKRITIEENCVNDNLKEYIVYVPKFETQKSQALKLIAGVMYIIGYLLGLLKIRRKEGKIDLIHINILTRAGIIPLLLKKLLHIPYIVVEHWTRYYPGKSFPNNSLHLSLTKSITNNASLILCAANRQIEAMKNCGLKNAHYSKFFNTYKPSEFHPRSVTKNELTTFLSVAMFRDHSKNISGILNVLKRLEKDGYNFNYVFIGDGEDFEILVNKAKEFGLQNIVFKGHQKANEIAQQLSKSNVSILFSNYENQPVSIIESLACGTPVIATDVGDVKEMIPEGCGVVIQPKDEDALYYEMVKVIKGKSKFSSERCLQESEKYNFENVGKAFSKIYSKALDY